jgi:hypothetical protein
MNSRHVYIENHYSFPTPSSKYRAFTVEGFFDVFHEIFPKYKEGNQYRVTVRFYLHKWPICHIRKHLLMI